MMSTEFHFSMHCNQRKTNYRSEIHDHRNRWETTLKTCYNCNQNGQHLNLENVLLNTQKIPELFHGEGYVNLANKNYISRNK